MTHELWRMSAVEAVARLRKREISPLELVEASAQRIAEVEPAVNALPTLCLDRAREHARRIMQGGADADAADEAGWLAGLPVSIKDLTDVAGVRTTYGSPLFADHVPEKSHPLVERIERKGGIVLGKSNTPEFGAGGSTFNEVFGRTRNPWNTSLTCGGSTGGGSVSLATGEVWLAQGTDHGGSLRRPGTYCSTVGIRRSFKEGLLGDASNIRASRSRESGFEALRTYPEFRDLVVTPTPLGVGPASRPVAPSGRSSGLPSGSVTFIAPGAYALVRWCR